MSITLRFFFFGGLVGASGSGSASVIAGEIALAMADFRNLAFEASLAS
eukprot:CAMPEP_0183536250 /NCGR_PEP_ID=MMETSP0371-20130417/28107_1 /TAXON_ID=268820 /ORGANISM="Peridinium aciculiferum, Strain PAER-2" /LENGTH=47 /DNA_ID= /DNA_START= /DNA_END= /DNA_ORIENTATION=